MHTSTALICKALSVSLKASSIKPTLWYIEAILTKGTSLNSLGTFSNANWRQSKAKRGFPTILQCKDASIDNTHGAATFCF